MITTMFRVLACGIVAMLATAAIACGGDDDDSDNDDNGATPAAGVASPAADADDDDDAAALQQGLTLRSDAREAYLAGVSVLRAAPSMCIHGYFGSSRFIR